MLPKVTATDIIRTGLTKLSQRGGGGRVRGYFLLLDGRENDGGKKITGARIAQ